MTLTQAAPTIGDLISFSGAQYSWVNNVEFTNINTNAISLYYLVQSEIRNLYMHAAIGGLGYGKGYGISISMYSSNNLVYNNIADGISGGGIETHGGASGNVIAYNFLNNITYVTPTYLTFSPKVNHGPYPKMNLWEGNMGAMAGGDFIWGSGGYDTVFRSRETGWLNGITTNIAAIRFAYGNRYMNVIGNVLGTSGVSSVYEVVAGDGLENATTPYIYVLGCDGIGGATDTQVPATIFLDGNFDYVTNTTIWDPTNINKTLPASLYLSAKPSWWCNETPWPPIGPDVAGMVNSIPAKRRFEGQSCTPGNAMVAPANLRILSLN
jgi:hypothetical protein